MIAKNFYEKYIELFEYYDYNFDRYNTSFSIAIIKFDDKINIDKVDLETLKRCSDKCLKMDKQSYFFIFLGTDTKKSYQALLNLEKNLIVKYNLYNIEHIFCGAVIGKKRNRNIEEMIRVCIELINECTTQQNIITEDDL